jgi:hypothetical protein
MIPADEIVHFFGAPVKKHWLLLTENFNEHLQMVLDGQGSHTECFSRIINSQAFFVLCHETCQCQCNTSTNTSV